MGVHGVRLGCALALASALGCSPFSEGAAGEADTDGTSGATASSTLSTTAPTSTPSTMSDSGTSSTSDDPTVEPSTAVASESETDPVDSDTGTATTETTGVGDDTTVGVDGTSTGEQPPEERRVFLTSETYTGSFGGALGADDNCQDLADAVALGGTWRAYIVDSANDLSRHTQDERPLVRLDGTLIADNWDDLNDGDILATIDLDEGGNERTGNAWTGFWEVGGAPDNWCEDWTFNGGDCLMIGVCGGGGESNMTDNHWDGFYVFNCSQEFRLYCIEQ